MYSNHLSGLVMWNRKKCDYESDEMDCRARAKSIALMPSEDGRGVPFPRRRLVLIREAIRHEAFKTMTRLKESEGE
jgi:hypothetical protein